MARFWQMVGVAVVGTVVAGWLPMPRSLTHDLPAQIRWASGLLGLAMGVGFLWFDRKLDLTGTWVRLPPWRRLVALFAVAGVLFLIRPRLHWGDSAALISALDGGVHRWNPRWLTSMVGLAYVFDPLRPLMSGTLFLTLAYIGLGCLDLVLFVATLRILSEGRRIPGVALLFAVSSPATLFLMSGYLEIYAMPQFGIVAFLWAAAAFSVRRPWMGFPSFGLVGGLASMLYVGNLILLPLGTALVGARLLSEPGQGWKARLRPAIEFGAGAFLGFYASLCLVIGEGLPGGRRMMAAVSSILSEPGLVLRNEAVAAVWYSPLLDSLTPTRVREYAEVWSLYGFFGLLFLLTLASMLIVDAPLRRWVLRAPADGFLPMLAGLITIHLLASYIKSRPMGWLDWDLFTYAVYPVNLLAACLLTRLQHVRIVGAVGRTFAICASVWCLMVYAYLNPVRPEWGLPLRKRASAFESYSPLSRVPPSDAESRGIRETSPFP